MNKYSKLLISGVIISSITLTPIVHCYAQPSFTNFIGNELGRWIGKKSNKTYKQQIKDDYKNYKEQQADETIGLFKEKSKNMTKQQVLGLKEIIDEILNQNGMVFKELSKQKSSIIGRLKNKKLIEEDHRIIRKYLNNLPNLEDTPQKQLSQFAKEWIKYYSRPTLDVDYSNPTIMYTPMPTLPTPSVNISPALAL